jgi:hypothetical protein
MTGRAGALSLNPGDSGVGGNFFFLFFFFLLLPRFAAD